MTSTRTAPSSAVAICAYTEHRWSDLLDAVRSVRAQQPAAPDQIVVVIDHNETLFERAHRELDGVDVCRSTGPRGLSGARNTAIDRTTAEVLAFLDDDAVAEPDWLHSLLANYDDPFVLGVGGHAKPLWAEGHRPSWFPAEFLWVVGCSHQGLPSTVGPVRNVIGCNMSFRTEVLRKVGGFDPGLGRTADRPLGCEETELCIRATELVPGGRVVLDPSAVVAHRVPASRQSWSYFLARCRAEGVSKAWVADRVGAASATATERGYVARTLPAAVGHGIGDIIRGDLSGAARIAAVTAGLASTATVFAFHRARGSGRATPGAVDDPGPLATFVVDRCDELVDLHRSTTPDGTPYAGAHVLVLDGHQPAGIVVVPFVDHVIAAPELAAALADLPSPDHRPAPVSGDPISVVIATRDRPEQLERCIRSIRRGSVLPTRIVVVDNAPSSTETEETVRRLAIEFPELRYVREDRPGLATAHNCGLRLVESPLVAITDDDVVVGEHWLAVVQSTFASDPRVDCVTGLIVPLELDTSTQRAIEAVAGFNKGWAPAVFDAGDEHHGPLFPYAAGMFGSGANMSFRTGYLRSVGGFDEALGAGTLSLGGDDLAAFYDVIAGGGRLRYEPAAFVRHAHHRTPGAFERQAHGYGAGLSAHLTRCVVKRPRAAFDFGRSAVAGLRRAGSISTPASAPPGAALRWPTVRGMSSGGVRYLVARARLRRTGWSESVRPPR